jgi:hypothetical protein
MGSKPFTVIAAILFLLAALVHIYRLITHFRVVAGTHTFPMWGSIVLIVIALILAWGLFRESRR